MLDWLLLSLVPQVYEVTLARWTKGTSALAIEQLGKLESRKRHLAILWERWLQGQALQVQKIAAICSGCSQMAPFPVHAGAIVMLCYV